MYADNEDRPADSVAQSRGEQENGRRSPSPIARETSVNDRRDDEFERRDDGERERERERSRSRDRDDRRRSSPPPRRESRAPEAPRRPPGAPVPEPTNVLGVFGLSIRTQERDLGDEFARHGEVEKVVIVYDQRSQRSRGFGFVTMRSVEDAQRCIEALNGIDLHGRRLRVDFSATTRPHDPTPGFYKGLKREDEWAPRGGGGGYSGGDRWAAPRRDERYGGGGRDRYDDRRGGYGGRDDRYGGGRSGGGRDRYDDRYSRDRSPPRRRRDSRSPSPRRDRDRDHRRPSPRRDDYDAPRDVPPPREPAY